MEILETIKNAFAKPFEKVDEHRIVVSEGYKVVEKYPVNHKESLARLVIGETIINKTDFIEFVKEYATPATKLFYTKDKIDAVFNYSTNDKADYCDSKATMPLLKTSQFETFSQRIGRKITQKDFIRFLKELENTITKFDGKPTDDMDIIEIAESLQAIKSVKSVMRNTLQSFTADVEISTGATSINIPRKITFEIAPYKNDLVFKDEFEVELFFDMKDGAFDIELVCYTMNDQVEKKSRELTESIVQALNDVKSFMV